MVKRLFDAAVSETRPPSLNAYSLHLTSKKIYQALLQAILPGKSARYFALSPPLMRYSLTFRPTRSLILLR